MKTPLSVVLASLATMTSARYISQQCFGNNVCAMLNIPRFTAQTGKGDVYISMTAPTTMNWVGIGQGSKMAGANMFIMYQDQSGQNVTVSSRLGTGEVQPNYDSAASYTMLAGSGINNGTMTANFRCSNCNSWDGGSGSMDFTAPDAKWIYAYKNGNGLNSNAMDANIQQHNKYGNFMFNFTVASGGPGAYDPFTSPEYSPVDNIPLTSSGVPAYSDVLVEAHGIVACTAFILFILGAILIRIASFSGAIWAHAACQVIAFLTYVAAVGMGLYMSTHGADFVAHNVIGLVVFGLLFIQPITGLVHHKTFQRKAKRHVASWFHLSTGRIIIILGLINGGLGLQVAAQSTGSYIGYGIGAGVLGLIYFAAIVYGETTDARERRNSDPKAALGGPEMGYQS